MKRSYFHTDAEVTLDRDGLKMALRARKVSGAFEKPMSFIERTGRLIWIRTL